MSFAHLLLAAALSAEPATVLVEVLEYPTRKPVSGAQVKLVEDLPDAGAPREVTVTTGEKGKGQGELPHLRFKFAEATKPGHLTPAELVEFADLITMKITAQREKRGVDGLYFQAWVVPRKFIDDQIKVRTEDEARKLADEWGRECEDKSPPQVSFYKREWAFRYPCMKVLVSMTGGSAWPLIPDVPSAAPLYPPEEALVDAMSSPLEYVATEHFEGAPAACVYRNKKVFVTNNYCTVREIRTTGIEILHPDKGWVEVYAEAPEPVSIAPREDYTQWRFESRTALPGRLQLSMNFQQLAKYELQRNRLAKGGCSAGIRMHMDKNWVCDLKTPEIAQWWEARYRPMLKDPPPEWYALMKELRKRAPKDSQIGKPKPKKAAAR